ncbi:MAG TPA: MarR family winged helix-turn-helix transcriptional regulator [Polyangia bacterium]|jgi:DNA-binding MarR family transcriptional regulator
MKRSWGPVPSNRNGKVIDLERYAPAYLTFVANKLGRGASRNYLRVFNVGVETWRCLVFLAIHGSITAQQVSQILGMDKAAVSRCFKGLQARKLITMGLDSADGRVRVATLTAAGRALHDEIRDMALERERALLSVLSETERDTLLKLLKRLHENLPAVEKATARYVVRRYPHVARRHPRIVSDSAE